MIIKIEKTNEGKIIFGMDNETYDFSYDSFSKLINKVYCNDDEVTYKTEEGLEEYEKLLSEIIKKCREEDYRNAVNEAKKAKAAMIKSEDALSQ